MGALLSVGPPLVLCAAAVANKDWRAFILGPDPKKDDDVLTPDLEGGSGGDRPPSRAGTDDDASSVTSSLATNETHVLPEVLDDQDEDLESVVVSNIESSLLRIQRLEAKIEERIGMSRSKSIDRIHDHKDQLKRTRSSRRPSQEQLQTFDPVQPYGVMDGRPASA